MVKLIVRFLASKRLRNEAAFWDTYSFEEFEEELEPIDVIFVPAGPKKRLTVRLDEQTFVELTRIAKDEGIFPAALASVWITQRTRRRDSADQSGISPKRSQ